MRLRRLLLVIAAACGGDDGKGGTGGAASTGVTSAGVTATTTVASSTTASGGPSTGDTSGATGVGASSTADATTEAGATTSTTAATTGDTTGACVPKSCADKGFECGSAKDGCGTKIECGTCPEGQVCESHHCVCQTLTCGADQCHEVADGCGGVMDCGFCDPLVAFCDDAAKTCAPHGMACDGDPAHEDECAFGVNPCHWSCNPIFNQTDQPFIPPCCDVIKETGDPFACCFDARRVCTPAQCAGIPADVNHQKCGQMWANGCCPVASDACPLPH